MCSFFSEISTSHEEYWLILTGLPSLLLDSISLRLVSAAVRCRLPIALLCLPSPTASLWVPSSNLSSRLSRTCLSYPTSGLVRDLESKPFVWFCTKTDKGIVCLAHSLHSVTTCSTRERINTSLRFPKQPAVLSVGEELADCILYSRERPASSPTKSVLGITLNSIF